MAHPKIIIASLMFYVAGTLGVNALETDHELRHKSVRSTGLAAVKDTAGMDALVDTLQDRGTNKVPSPSIPVRRQRDDKATYPPPVVAVLNVEASGMDLRVLIAALALVGVIAMRRIT